MEPERRIPVVVGVGQISDRPAQDDEALDTLGLMKAALERADHDAGGGFLRQADTLGIVDQMSWEVVAWPSAEKITPYLVAALGIAPRHAYATEDPSGDGPVRLINDAANRIGDGLAEVVAVVGGEALRTAARRAAARARSGEAAKPNAVRDHSERNVRPFLKKHGLMTPIDVYPLYEHATRAAWGQTLEDAQQESGLLGAGYAQAAAANPVAWIRRTYEVEEITRVSPENRIMGFPYTKLMVANSSVNQGAAVIITSLAKAREMGVPEGRLAYIGPGAAAREPEDFFARDRYDRSPSMAVSIRKAMELNGLATGDLDCVELYNCFPCVPKMARRVLGWPIDKLPSVYGGLTFGGGPIGNCMMHAAVCMVERLRGGDVNGLIFANGGYASHSHSIVLTRRPVPAGTFPQDYDFQPEADAARGAIPTLDEAYTGPGVIETYAVPFDAGGKPRFGTVIGRSSGGVRFLARVPGDDIGGIEFLTSGRVEPVGTVGRAETAGEEVVWRRA